MAKIAVIYYSLRGHVHSMALSVKQGVESAGQSCDIFQIPETIPEEKLKQMHAPPKSSDPIATVDILAQYDGYLLGIPARYGNFPTQWKQFWDDTAGLWFKGSLDGKFAGVFFSTGTLGGGQESTALSIMSTLTHHGIIYIPLGYKTAFSQLTNVEEVHGGSPWGAGTFSGMDGKRTPTELEKEMARLQGKKFAQILAARE